MTKDNEKENEQWYTNKNLFEMIQALKTDVQGLSSELKITRDIIIKYNGLREEIEKFKTRVTTIEEQAKGKSIFGTNLREWTGWVIAVIMLVWTFIKG